MNSHIITSRERILLIISTITTLLCVVITYLYIQERASKVSLERSLLSSSNEMKRIVFDLEAKIASSTVENRDLNDFLTILKARNEDFKNEITEKDIKVATLQKLTGTDKELLQKYSKNYFLNENYVPNELSTIGSSFLFRNTIPEQIHTKVKPYLEAMLNAAKADGVEIFVLSGYRSFETQKNIKARHSTIYGTASNRFSADQGYSEHQLGTTLDLTTKKTGASLSGFENDPAYSWLQSNAHKFGFTLSYPKGNNYYIFEPWHWRFVGVALAEYLHSQNKYLYELSEREIDNYLIKIFD